jgi:hypothetical protein
VVCSCFVGYQLLSDGVSCEGNLCGLVVRSAASAEVLSRARWTQDLFLGGAQLGPDGQRSVELVAQWLLDKALA